MGRGLRERGMMKDLPNCRATEKLFIAPIKIDEENFGDMKNLTTFVSLSE